ncbi:DNA starvation/stationary phase protection protein [Shimazuella sp. AN120528]|uniref:Dps family protein n=1 Tax=Shimazuella soli TaxID=1892854 RepID=UPI001F107103|nr:DNA starvation/stationary phase protection protein [Shimazuella soli]MCH5584149.1 DNA starvation/stationary phase protection protein [Shimazuella soli]
MNQSVQDAINKQVANWSLLYTKFHNYHWYVKGSTFFELHAKFEELYREADVIIDELAERLLAIGGKPAATFQDILAKASLKEASGNESTDQMVHQLVSDFQQLTSELREAIHAAEEAKDYPTADILTGVLTKIEKHNWMLGAYLG